MHEPFKGWTLYEGLYVHQVEQYLPVWTEFLTQARPARILEIGTADGGFVLSLWDQMQGINPHCTVRSYDIAAKAWYPDLIARGVDIRVENIFTYPYDALLPEKQVEMRQFIQEPGTTVVICDGGSKKNEFRLLAPFLKTGDFILAHDYAETEERFEAEIKGRIWNWCEITEHDMRAASATCNLIPFMKEPFQSIVWCCKQRSA